MLKAALFHVSIPMKREFSHARTSRHDAESLILEIELQGVKGIGECVPRNYVTGESIDSVIDAVKKVKIVDILSKISQKKLDIAVDNLKNLAAYDLPNNAHCLLEMALLDWVGKFFEISISKILKNFIFTSLTVRNENKTSFETSQVLDLSIKVEDFINCYGPFHYIKVKVDGDLKKNVKKLHLIREALGHKIKLSVDANMAWTYKEAIKQISELNKFSIDYYEEPLQSRKWDLYSKLRREKMANILLDESVCDLNDLELAIQTKACDAVNIRISKCGGIVSAANMINLAAQNGLRYQIGAQVAETGPLISAGRHLICAVNKATAFEAGQPDRLFNGDYIISPMPLVDRTTNLASQMDGYGLGCHLSSAITKFSKRKIDLIGNTEI